MGGMTTDVGSVNVGIDVDTGQLEDAIGKVEEFAELTADMSPQVTIRNCRGCTFNIYPSRTVFMKEES